MNPKYIILFMLFPLLLSAQNDSIKNEFNFVELDSVVISAVKKGLNIGDLIELMKYDSTLYIAFNNLHFANYTYTNNLNALNKKEEVTASKSETIKQTYDNKCRKQEILDQKTEGNFLNKKGNYRFYTAELFNRTLYSPQPICNEKRKKNWKAEVYGSKTEGHLGAIKRVIFNPGSPVSLPIIGNKFAIFGTSMQRYYDYSIEHKIVNKENCYVFSVLIKPKYAKSRKDVVVRKLVTTFRKSDYQIISRDYHLKYKGALIKLDIEMAMQLTEVENLFYPKQIDYKGFFKVPTKGSESIEFVTDFLY